MPTILLEQIIELLTGWKDSFFSWANEIGDKIASIKTNTDSLPDIESNTDDIKDNTAAVITPISNINSNVTSISSDVSTIKTDTGIIKNNASAIATSSGAAAAFAEDVANNTLEVKNKITTIASDTTQMRADSGSIRSDVSEIKNTLGLYLYNTIVTEDSEGSICNFDTDLKDYLQEAKVNIPVDAGGISEAKVGYVDMNQLINYGNFSASTGWNPSSNVTMTVNDNKCTLTANNTISNNASIYRSITAPANHIYLISAVFTSNTTTTVRISSNSGVLIANTTIGNQRIKLSSIRKLPTNNTYFQIYINVNSQMQENDYVILENIQLIDLTQAFGDPAETFILDPDYAYKIFNKDYYSYDAGGSLVSVESVNGSYYPNASVSFGSSITDGGELNLVTGVLKVNTTPPSLVQLTPAPIRTLKGLNSIWADCGDISVTYRETLKHYLEKQQ